MSNSRLAAGALALGLAIFGCAAELDRSQDYDWAYADSAGGSGNGGSGNPGGGMTSVPDDPQCLKTIITNQCATCHSASSAASLGKGLDLTSSNIGQRLVNKDSACDGDPKIINTSDKNNSAFLLRVTGAAKGCSKLVMPPGGALMGADLQCVQEWINKF
ncbi:MAG TPA: hypothetical protein VFQ35_13680 [Polyangiaceae bacterium]|nr:hypothetical protein [Polyangiaceae bacterium]